MFYIASIYILKNVSKIKKKINSNLSDEEKNKILQQITCLILLFQLDNLYKNVSSNIL